MYKDNTVFLADNTVYRDSKIAIVLPADLIIFLCPSVKKMEKITVLSSELKDCSGAYRDIRKRFILFTILLNVYFERIFQKSIRNMRKGVYVNGTFLNNMQHKDNTVF